MRKAAVVRIVLVVGAVGAVELLCRTGVISPFTMIPPSEMVTTLAGLLASGQMSGDIAFTAGNLASSMALAIVSGFAVGVLLHSMPRLRRVVSPLLAGYYAVPIFVFYPLLILMLGLNRMPLIVIGGMSGVVAMIVNTLDGIDRIPRVYLKTAATYRMNALSTALLVKLPGAAPHLITGVKLAITYSMIGTIAGEFILSIAGVGRHIALAYNNLDNRTMYALLLLLLLSVTVINVAIHEWEHAVRRVWGSR